MDILKKHENHTRLRWSMVILCFVFAEKGLHRGGQSWCLIKHQLWSVLTNQTLSRSVFIKVLLSLSLFYQTRSYPLYQYQLWSSLTSEPPHQSQRILTLYCKCCFNKAKQTLHVCKNWEWCKARSKFLQAFLFSKWAVFCRMVTSVHGTTRQTFCG